MVWRVDNFDFEGRYTDEWNCISLKNFSSAMESLRRMERQPVLGEKTFRKHKSERGLVFGIPEELSSMGRKYHSGEMGRRQALLKKWHMSLAPWYMTKCFEPPIIKEMQIKDHIRGFTFPLLGWPLSNRQ